MLPEHIYFRQYRHLCMTIAFSSFPRTIPMILLAIVLGLLAKTASAFTVCVLANAAGGFPLCQPNDEVSYNGVGPKQYRCTLRALTAQGTMQPDVEHFKYAAQIAGESLVCAVIAASHRCACAQAGTTATVTQREPHQSHRGRGASGASLA